MGGGITAYWDHVTNSFRNVSNAMRAVGPYLTSGPLARSGDYSRIMLGYPTTGGTVQIIDGNTGQVLQQMRCLGFSVPGKVREKPPVEEAGHDNEGVRAGKGRDTVAAARRRGANGKSSPRPVLSTITGLPNLDGKRSISLDQGFNELCPAVDFVVGNKLTVRGQIRSY